MSVIYAPLTITRKSKEKGHIKNKTTKLKTVSRTTIPLCGHDNAGLNFWEHLAPLVNLSTNNV